MEKERPSNLRKNSTETRESAPYVTVYHSRYGNETPMDGQAYTGSSRGKLSEFLGGRVGFAYLARPDNEKWRNSPAIFEVKVPADAVCILSLNGEGVPHFEECLYGQEEEIIGNVHKYKGKVRVPGETIETHYAVGPIGELKALYGDRKNLGELVFPTQTGTKTTFFGPAVTRARKQKP